MDLVLNPVLENQYEPRLSGRLSLVPVRRRWWQSEIFYGLHSIPCRLVYKKRWHHKACSRPLPDEQRLRKRIPALSCLRLRIYYIHRRLFLLLQSVLAHPFQYLELSKLIFQPVTGPLSFLTYVFLRFICCFFLF